MNKDTRRADYVPAAPITRALRDWLREQGLGAGPGSGTLAREGRYFSPFGILAERLDVTDDTIYRYSKNLLSYEWMNFDLADKFLCATDRFHWWWCDPELSKWYEIGAIGADRVYPIAA